jgi:hypothetical protein
MGVWGESVGGSEVLFLVHVASWRCGGVHRVHWRDCGQIFLTLLRNCWISTMNMLQIHRLRPLRFTPVIYHVPFSSTVGTARIAQLVLWLDIGLDDWEILFWFLVGARDVSVVQRIQTECWVLPSLRCSGYKGLFFLGVKWWGMKLTLHPNLYCVQCLFETSDLALLCVL